MKVMNAEYGSGPVAGLALPPPEEAEPLVVGQERLSERLQNYVLTLVRERPFTITVLVDQQHVEPKLSAFWPKINGWDDAAHQLINHIGEMVRTFPIKEVSPQFLLCITAASSRLAPQLVRDSVQSVAIGMFDGVSGIEKNCVLSHGTVLPDLEGMAIKRGVMVMCQPTLQIFNPMTDSRPLGIGAGSIYSERNIDPLLGGDATYEDLSTMARKNPVPLNSPTHMRDWHIAIKDRARMEGNVEGAVIGTAAAAALAAAALARHHHNEEQKKAAEKAAHQAKEQAKKDNNENNHGNFGLERLAVANAEREEQMQQVALMNSYEFMLTLDSMEAEYFSLSPEQQSEEMRQTLLAGYENLRELMALETQHAYYGNLAVVTAARTAPEQDRELGMPHELGGEIREAADLESKLEVRHELEEQQVYREERGEAENPENTPEIAEAKAEGIETPDNETLEASTVEEAAEVVNEPAGAGEGAAEAAEEPTEQEHAGENQLEQAEQGGEDVPESSASETAEAPEQPDVTEAFESAAEITEVAEASGEVGNEPAEQPGVEETAAAGESAEQAVSEQPGQEPAEVSGERGNEPAEQPGAEENMVSSERAEQAGPEMAEERSEPNETSQPQEKGSEQQEVYETSRETPEHYEAQEKPEAAQEQQSFEPNESRNEQPASESGRESEQRDEPAAENRTNEEPQNARETLEHADEIRSEAEEGRQPEARERQDVADNRAEPQEQRQDSNADAGRDNQQSSENSPEAEEGRQPEPRERQDVADNRAEPQEQRQDSNADAGRDNQQSSENSPDAEEGRQPEPRERQDVADNRAEPQEQRQDSNADAGRDNQQSSENSPDAEEGRQPEPREHQDVADNRAEPQEQRQERQDNNADAGRDNQQFFENRQDAAEGRQPEGRDRQDVADNRTQPQDNNADMASTNQPSFDHAQHTDAFDRNDASPTSPDPSSQPTQNQEDSQSQNVGANTSNAPAGFDAAPAPDNQSAYLSANNLHSTNHLVAHVVGEHVASDAFHSDVGTGANADTPAFPEHISHGLEHSAMPDQYKALDALSNNPPSDKMPEFNPFATPVDASFAPLHAPGPAPDMTGNVPDLQPQRPDDGNGNIAAIATPDEIKYDDAHYLATALIKNMQSPALKLAQGDFVRHPNMHHGFTAKVVQHASAQMTPEVE